MFQGITAFRGNGANVLVVHGKALLSRLKAVEGLQKIDFAALKTPRRTEPGHTVGQCVKAARGKDHVQALVVEMERTMSKPLAIEE
jgi:hypothetical protein